MTDVLREALDRRKIVWGAENAWRLRLMREFPERRVIEPHWRPSYELGDGGHRTHIPPQP